MGLANVSVYPNPFEDKINIEFAVKDQAEYTFAIYDITGRLVDRLSGTVTAGSHIITWNSDAADLRRGYYIYKFEVGNLRKSGKLLLTR